MLVIALIIAILGFLSTFFVRLIFLGQLEYYGIVSEGKANMDIAENQLITRETKEIKESRETDTTKEIKETKETYESYFPEKVDDTNGTKQPYTSHKELGPIGDWLGGSSTPLFTLASFIVLVAAYMSQRKELKSTLEEFDRQNKTMSKQRFENTFFQMVSLHHEIVNAIHYNGTKTETLGLTKVSTSVELNGRKYFKWFVEHSGVLNKDEPYTIEGLKQLFASSYHEDILGHYFRNLYHIFKLIHESEELIKNGESRGNGTYEEKKKYVRIIRAQLSTHELVLILYNSLTDDGKEFHELIKEYQILNNLKKQLLPDALHEIFEDMDQYSKQSSYRS